MPLVRLANYFGGVVHIRLLGRQPERLLNLCVANDIFLWQVKRRVDCLEAWISLGDFFRIRPLAKTSQTKVKVIGYDGFPFMWKRIRKRYVLLFGFFICFAILYGLSQFIWFVDMTGQEVIAEEHLRNVLQEEGLKIGALRKDLDTKQIEKKVMNQFPQLGWISIEVKGTRAFVQLVEKTEPTPQDKKAAHVIAGRDGLITEIVVIQGQARVKKGDTVKKGDVLISGKWTDPVDGSEKTVRAQGIVKARVWYESYGETPLIIAGQNRTGEIKRALSFKLGEKEFPLTPLLGPAFEYYEQEQIAKKFPWWRNQGLSVEFTIHTYYETLPFVFEKLPEQGQEEAKAKALQALEEQIPRGAQILQKNIEILKTGEADIARAKVTVETQEVIGEMSSIM